MLKKGPFLAFNSLQRFKAGQAGFAAAGSNAGSVDVPADTAVAPHAWQYGENALLRVLHAVQGSNKPMPQCGQKSISLFFKSTGRSQPGQTFLASRASAVS